jgi:hypothetical protein
MRLSLLMVLLLPLLSSSKDCRICALAQRRRERAETAYNLM